MVAWTSSFPDEPYELDLSGEGKISLTRPLYSGRSSGISYNLADAVLRQQNFYYQVSGPHYVDENFLRAAVARYKAFLHLVFRHTSAASVFLVPTYDIDLIWHTHQLHPVSYRSDLTRLFGRIFEHDDTDSNRDPGGKLDKGFAKTLSLWESLYDLPYEKAGCMYRGEPPAAISGTIAYDPTKLASLSCRTKVSLKARNTIQVRLSVRGSKGLPQDGSVSFVFSMLKQTSFELHSEKREGSSPRNVVSSMTPELSTEGLVITARQKGMFTSKTLGRLVIPWKNLSDSETQSLGGWFPMQDTKKDREVSVLVYISATPPVTANYLLRSVRVEDTGEDGATRRSFSSQGVWITRTVFDHANKECFVIRCRYKREGGKRLADTDKVVNVHRTYKGSRSVDGEVLGSARQLERPSKDSRRWSLLDDAIVLVVEKDAIDKQWNTRPGMSLNMEIKSEDCPIALLPGRHLEFSVPGSSDQMEACFVTMVRFTSDAPQGKATALINWRSGGMEIDPNEDVLLVLLFSATISMSMSDMLGKGIPPWAKPRALEEDQDHWGAVKIDHDGLGGEIYSRYNDGFSYVGGCGISAGGGCGGGGCGSWDLEEYQEDISASIGGGSCS
ncbi:glycine-rich domain-containing protein 1-like [Selaginella moellendorffii]|uniref:glycine-rich domain-containing protein 1-like n=1 Tax=Selaginella moellendorffii TaxID=88036 RepID=UPI000D1C538D|nr:glycine-rich domain-containing protein 1-like [Selaginella moellendorffii]|eukprot:XP_024537305.1 glycine-rich domain-containing protein 1-like [Selaginella moellendorffii]